MVSSVLYSSANEVWGTPLDFFEKLDAEFHFDLDPCALPENAKCKRYFTPDDDGLRQNWGGQKCSAIHHTDGRSASGLENVMRKERKKILSLLCLSQQGQIQNGFTNISTEKRKSVSCVVGLNSVHQITAHHSQVWL